jgi:hypothetical protein
MTVTVPLSPTGTYDMIGYGLTTKQYAVAPFQLTSAVMPQVSSSYATAPHTLHSPGAAIFTGALDRYARWANSKADAARAGNPRSSCRWSRCTASMHGYTG